ncbi:MAG: hypothetical protein AB7G87_03710 [Clostridia bacterium]
MASFIKKEFQVEREELDKFKENVPPYNPKTSTGGMNEKIRELMAWYNKNPQEADKILNKK